MKLSCQHKFPPPSHAMKKLKALKEMSDDLVQGSENIDSIGTT